ncbi:hypothetical protein GCM10027072_05090 [Streptomyces bullii]
MAHRVWEDDWVTLPCGQCGRRGEWPHPELGCACGTVLRIRVTGSAPRTGTDESPARAETGESPGRAGTREGPGRTGTGESHAPAEHQAFRPVPVRTALDVVMAAALCLRRLGHGDIRRADRRPPSGVALAARGVLAQVEPTVRAASLRDVECLWLTAMTESKGCVYFSLAGYTDDARARADALGVPLFVLDSTGTPQPVNGPAHALRTTGA